VQRIGCAALAAIAASLIVVGAPTTASAASAPAEGVFENCRLDTAMQTCLQRLHVMRAGGIRVVVIPASSGSLASLASYAATAGSLRMSIMWELSNPGWWQQPATGTLMAGQFPTFANACGCEQNGALLAFVADWLGSLPATYGYYAADDSMLGPGDQPGVAGYVAQIERQDPRHAVMISSFGVSQARQYEAIHAMIGQEIYPVTTTPLLPVAANQRVWRSVGQRAVETQRMADSADQPSAFILQAFSWGDNLDDGVAVRACTYSESKSACNARLHYPRPAAQWELRNEVLRHARPKLILWWSFPGTYGDATGDTYSIYPTGAEAAARWRGLSAAIRAAPPTARSTTALATAARHSKTLKHRRPHKRRAPRGAPARRSTR